MIKPLLMTLAIGVIPFTSALAGTVVLPLGPGVRIMATGSGSIFAGNGAHMRVVLNCDAINGNEGFWERAFQGNGAFSISQPVHCGDYVINKLSLRYVSFPIAQIYLDSIEYAPIETSGAMGGQAVRDLQGIHYPLLGG